MQGENSNVKRFHTIKQRLGSKYPLDQDFMECPNVKFKGGLTLYPHQTVVVQAMLDLEDNRRIEVFTKQYNNVTIKPVRLETTAMVLSEPFGSGKTFEILAFIMLKPIPKAFPTYQNFNTMLEGNVDDFKRSCTRETHFDTDIIRKYVGKRALIRPNLIIVGSSVMEQWYENITKYTDMKCLKIGNCRELREFAILYEKGMISGYDIILLKNGTHTGIINNSSTDDKIDGVRSTITSMYNITRQSCWSRVIYDDFDTIAIPPGSPLINALFSVYVSATTKSIRVNNKAYDCKDITEIVCNRRTPLYLVTKDRFLFTNFNISNSEEFVSKSTSLPIIECYRYVYDNPDDNYIRLLGSMGEEDANDLMEMLNGDAINEAANKLGIVTNSVADIFKRVLDKKYEKYIHDQNVLELIESLKESIYCLEPHPEQKLHSIGELQTIRSAISKCAKPTIHYFSNSLFNLFEEMEAEYKEAKEQDGLAIARVIDNIKEGECQVCRLPLEDFDAFIVRCCGIIVCDVCGIKGNQIAKKYDYKRKCVTICGACANCKSVVYPEDLLFVDRNFDLQSLMKSKGTEIPEIENNAEIEEIQEQSESEPEVKIKNPKLKALLSIINGEMPEQRERITLKIGHLLNGKFDNPLPKTEKPKVLVFANFNETLNNVEELLVSHNITYLRLGGTYQEKARTVKRFEEYGQVLLINSQQHCAGLDLQMCSTDLVYMHKIMDENIEAQVAGRIQRIGRQHNARIHYLCYKNEANRV